MSKNSFLIFFFRLLVFINDLKQKLLSFDPDYKLLFLDIIDFLIDNGNINHWIQISSPDFFKVILSLVKSGNQENVQLKILGLIKKWGLLFENKKNKIPNFSQIYKNLYQNGIVFPDNYISSYQKYLSNTPLNTNININNNINNNNYIYNNNDNIINNNNKEEYEFDYLESLQEILDPSKFDTKYMNLIEHLKLMIENISFGNELIDNKKKENLNEVINNLKNGTKSLINVIQKGKVHNEYLLEICIGINDDANRTLNRIDNFNTGKKIDNFLSYFIEKGNFFNHDSKKKMKSNYNFFKNLEKNQKQEITNSLKPLIIKNQLDMSQAPIASSNNNNKINNQLNMTCPEHFSFGMKESFTSNNSLVQNSYFNYSNIQNNNSINSVEINNNNSKNSFNQNNNNSNNSFNHNNSNNSFNHNNSNNSFNQNNSNNSFNQNKDNSKNSFEPKSNNSFSPNNSNNSFNLNHSNNSFNLNHSNNSFNLNNNSINIQKNNQNNNKFNNSFNQKNNSIYIQNNNQNNNYMHDLNKDNLNNENVSISNTPIDNPNTYIYNEDNSNNYQSKIITKNNENEYLNNKSSNIVYPNLENI